MRKSYKEPPPIEILRKFTEEEKQSVLDLRAAHNYGPKKLAAITGLPIGQIRFWLYASQKSYYQKNKEKIKSQHRVNPNRKRNSKNAYWRKKYKDWVTYKSQTIRSSLRKHSKEAPSTQELREWIRKNLTTCYYCQITLTEENFSVDHKLPVALGGTNIFSNLAACCRSCNLAKGTLTDTQFLDLLAFIQTWPETAWKSVLARLKRGFKF